jgi:methyl coenzyme M reductase subunit D
MTPPIEPQEKEIVSEVLENISRIPRQDLTPADLISRIMEIEPVKRVFVYGPSHQGAIIFGVVISLSNEAKLSRQSRLIVEDIPWRFN